MSCQTLIAPVLCALALSACALKPHNDVLIFGTNTKFAIDVSQSAATGGTPSLTVGFTRQEAVWAPLLANGVSPDDLKSIRDEINDQFEECKSENLDEIDSCIQNFIDAVKYVGKRTTNQGGDPTQQTDAYSVCASFRSNFSGGANSAGGGIGQWFATGIAAQQLCNKEGLVDALKVDTSDAKVEKNLKVQNENLAQQNQALQEAVVRGEQIGSYTLTEVERRKNAVFACARPENDAAKWKELVEKARAADPNGARLTTEYDQLRDAKKDATAERIFAEELDLSSERVLTAIADTACPQ